MLLRTMIWLRAVIALFHCGIGRMTDNSKDSTKRVNTEQRLKNSSKDIHDSFDKTRNIAARQMDHGGRH